MSAVLALAAVSGAAANSSSEQVAIPSFGNLCRVVEKSSPSAAQERARAARAERWASAGLREALDRLVLARRVSQGASPVVAESAAKLIQDVYARDVGFWLSVKRELCACSILASEPPPSCAELGEERHRAMCEGAPPRRGRGVDICRLTKGR